MRINDNTKTYAFCCTCWESCCRGRLLVHAKGYYTLSRCVCSDCPVVYLLGFLRRHAPPTLGSLICKTTSCCFAGSGLQENVSIAPYLGKRRYEYDGT